VLPRHWDGRRLLRFLTGLAMLALAFTVHVSPPAPAVAAVPPAAVSSPVAPVSSSPVAEEPVASLPALPPETPVAIGFAVLLLLAGARLLSVRTERAPPLV
jgi:hypothetical protein